MCEDCKCKAGEGNDGGTAPAGGADIQKFLITTIAASFFMLGFSYTNSYFRTFGLGILDLDLSVTDVIARGVVLLETWEAVLTFCFIAIVAAISQLPWIVKRNWLHSTVFLLGFLVSAALTNAIGASIGKENAISVANAESGKRAYCSLSKNGNFADNFPNIFNELTNNENIVSKIFENTETVYLSAGIWKNTKGEKFGTTYAIPRNSIDHCILVGN